MAHFHTKIKKGRPYLYVREIARVLGKPKVISQVYIGSPERVKALATADSDAANRRLRVEQFGALWLANQMDLDVDLAAMVDAVIPSARGEKGPSVGEYFLYCVLNRMVETRSKNRLSQWYGRTAIQHIRPTDIEQLTSARYWEKWERVSQPALEKIGRQFFEKIWGLESPDPDCLLFDTTNYYTFMASDTKSELAMRGNNKAGRHQLRQIGLGLLVARKSRLPLYCCIYPGNIHDSKIFHAIMDEMFGIACGLHKECQQLTVVIDKGINSAPNYAWLDERSQLHFITGYSPYFAQQLATTPLKKFDPVDTEKNRQFAAQQCPEKRLLAFRTTGEFWGRERTVVVTHNPATATKKNYVLNKKLETLHQRLTEMQAKVRNQEPHWRDPTAIKERYQRLCRQLHVSSKLFGLTFSPSDGTGHCLTMSYRRSAYQIEKARSFLGRNIIITDNTDWTTEDIVQASLDRWQVEDAFRLSNGNDEDLVEARPVRHWTDSKIRCHLFSCVVALTYLRRLELRLQRKGLDRTAASVMDEMKHLHSVLSLTEDGRQLKRRLETPSDSQAEVLHALGYTVDHRGVLQSLAG